MPKKQIKKSSKAREKVQVDLDPDVEEMLQKMRTMKEDLEVKMLEIFEKGDVSSKEIQNFLQNPENFPQQMKTRIEKELKKLETQMFAATGKKPPQEKPQPKTSVKDTKKRRKKMLGSRKKWLQM